MQKQTCPEDSAHPGCTPGPGPGQAEVHPAKGTSQPDQRHLQSPGEAGHLLFSLEGDHSGCGFWGPPSPASWEPVRLHKLTFHTKAFKNL